MTPLAILTSLMSVIPLLFVSAVLGGYPLLRTVQAQAANGQERTQAGSITTVSDSSVFIERGNPQRTGVYPADATLPTGEISWETWKLFEMKRGRIQFGPTTRMSDSTGSITISGPDIFTPYAGVGYSDPIVAEGILYFSVYIGDGYFYAVDVRTGKVEWRTKREKGAFSPPVIAGGTLYIGADSGLFYAFDLKKRQEKWRHMRPDQSSVGRSPVVADGFVYYVTSNGTLNALTAETGELKWTFETKSPNLSVPAVSNGLVYFTTQEYLYSVDGQSGKEMWKLQRQDGMRTPVVANGLVYFRDDEGHIRTVDARSGQPQQKPKKDHQTGARIAINNQTIYFTGWDTGSLFAVDAVTRETKWTFSDTSQVRCTAPITDSQRVYITCGDGRLYAVDAKTGKKVWTTDRKKAPLSTPVIANSVVYYVSDDGKVYAVK